MKRNYRWRGFLRQAASIWLLLLLIAGGAVCLSLAGDAVETFHRSATAHSDSNEFLYSRWDGQQSDATGITQPILKVGSFSVRRPGTEKFIGGWWDKSEETLLGALPAENWLESETKQALRDKLIFNQDTDYDFSEWLSARQENAIRDLTTGSADYLTDYFVGMTEDGAQRLSFVRNIEWDYQTALGERRWQTGLSALGALRETNDDAIVWQLRGYAAEESSAGANVGLIYRRVVEETLLGGNVFLDYEQYGDDDDSFLRWSFGAELRSAWFDIFANRYEGITDGKEKEGGRIIVYTQSGHDIELRVHAPQYRWVSGGLTYYKWEGEYYDEGNDDEGLRYNLAFDLFADEVSGLKLELDIDSPEDGGTNLGGRIAYRHTFGAPVSGGSSGYGEATFDPRAYFFSPVRREYAQRIVESESGCGTDQIRGDLISDTVELVTMGVTMTMGAEGYQGPNTVSIGVRTDQTGSAKFSWCDGSATVDPSRDTVFRIESNGQVLRLQAGEITVTAANITVIGTVNPEEEGDWLLTLSTGMAVETPHPSVAVMVRAASVFIDVPGAPTQSLTEVSAERVYYNYAVDLTVRSDGTGLAQLERPGSWMLDMISDTTISFLDEGRQLNLHSGEVTLARRGEMERVEIGAVIVTLIGTDLVLEHDPAEPSSSATSSVNILLREGEIAYAVPAASPPEIMLHVSLTTSADSAVAKVEENGREQEIGCEGSQRWSDDDYRTDCADPAGIPIPESGVTLVLEAQGEEVTLRSGGGANPVVTVVSSDGRSTAIYETDANGNYPFSDDGFMVSVEAGAVTLTITTAQYGETTIPLTEDQAVGKNAGDERLVPGENTTLTVTDESGNTRGVGGALMFAESSPFPINSQLSVATTQTVSVSGGEGRYSFELSRPNGGDNILEVTNPTGLEAVLVLYSEKPVTVTYHLTARPTTGDAAAAVLTIVARASDRLDITGERRIEAYTRSLATVTLGVSGDSTADIVFSFLDPAPDSADLTLQRIDGKTAEIRVVSTSSFESEGTAEVIVEASDPGDSSIEAQAATATIQLSFVHPPDLAVGVYYSNNIEAPGGTLYLPPNDMDVLLNTEAGYVLGEGGSAGAKIYTRVGTGTQYFRVISDGTLEFNSNLPTGVSTVDVEVEVRDTHPDVNTVTVTVVAFVGGGISFPPSIDTLHIPDDRRGVVHTVTASGSGSNPITYDVEGSNRVRVNRNNGEIEIVNPPNAPEIITVTVRAEQVLDSGVTVTAFMALTIVFVGDLEAMLSTQGRFTLGFGGILASIAVSGGVPPYDSPAPASGWNDDIKTDYIDTGIIAVLTEDEGRAVIISVAEPTSLTAPISFDAIITITDSQGTETEVTFEADVADFLAIVGDRIASVKVDSGDTGELHRIEVAGGQPQGADPYDDLYTIISVNPSQHASLLEVGYRTVRGEERGAVSLRANSLPEREQITAAIEVSDAQLDSEGNRDTATLSLVIEVRAPGGLYWVTRGISARSNRFLQLDADGTEWASISRLPSDVVREGPAVYDDGKIWLLGGRVSREVWYYDTEASAPAWVQAANGGFPAREDARAVVHNGSLFVMGGGSGAASRQVWASGDDGGTWTRVSPAGGADWSARERPALVSHGGVIWLFGGSDGSTNINDIWVSEDGANWREITPKTGFDLRALGNNVYYDAVFFKGKFRIYNTNGLQRSSADGVNWDNDDKTSGTDIFDNALDFGIAGHTKGSEGTLWIAGGGSSSSEYKSWYSVDGVSWTTGPEVSPDTNPSSDALLSNEPQETGDLLITPSVTMAAGIPAGSAAQAVVTLLAVGGSGGNTYAFSGDSEFSYGRVPAGVIVSVDGSSVTPGTLTAVIAVTDSSGSTESATVEAAFIPTNVDIETSYSRRTVPTEARGEVVAIVAGTGAPGPYTYAISGGADGDEFEIDSSSGNVRLKSSSTVTGDLEVIVEATYLGSSATETLDVEVLEDPLFVADIRGNMLEIRGERQSNRWAELAPRPQPYTGGHLEYPAVVHHSGTIWFLGGNVGGEVHNDVWYYHIGKDEWSKSTTGSKFAAVQGAAGVVHGGTIFLLGGQEDAIGGVAQFSNKVWASEDGHNWTQIASSTQSNRFPARKGAVALVHAGSLYLLSGNTGSGAGKTDAWASVDGVNWVNKRTGTDYPAKYQYGAASFGGTLFLFNGQDNGNDYASAELDDIWFSTDHGVNWEKHPTAIDLPFHPRSAAISGSPLVVTEHDGRLYSVIFGFKNPNWRTEAWHSTDGIDWTGEGNDRALWGNGVSTSSASQGQNGTPYIISTE